MVLHSRVQTGVDKFNAPVYTETSETVDNVLVQPVSAEAIVNDLQLYGHRAAYELCIPKGDAHNWTGCRVEFSARVGGSIRQPRNGLRQWSPSIGIKSEGGTL